MDTLRDLTGLQQALLLTFRAPAHDLARTMEDIRAIEPLARCAPGGGEGGDAGIAIELPDRAGLLERLTPVIFRAQHGLTPALSVRRVLASFDERASSRDARPAKRACISRLAEAA